jgi:carbonic anhydrase
MKAIVLSVLVGCVLLASCIPCEEKPKHWSYSGEAGPENWVKLSSRYSDCGGKNQSPIDLTDFITAAPPDLKPITISYHAGGDEILNNGHTVEVSYVAGSSILVDGTHQFNLDQFHFHAPGENRINGTSYAMEAHFVHKDKYGNIAVIALMFAEGAENNALAKIWTKLPEDGKKIKLSPSFNVEELLPKNRDYYRYNGSLTTPPCTEGVLWLVLKQPVTASKAQIDAFRQIMHHPNNRPLQPINAREVLQ